MDASGKLGASAIRAYVMTVKMVVASAIDEQGEQLYPPQVEPQVHRHAAGEEARATRPS